MGMEAVKKILPILLMAAILAALVLYGSGENGEERPAGSRVNAAHISVNRSMLQ